MTWDFLRTPSLETTYFVVFGSVAVFGVAMLLLGSFLDRRQRSLHRPDK